MKRILVTGANGFVGRRVCCQLVAGRFTVRGAYRRNPRALPGGVEPFRIDSIEEFLGWDAALRGIDAVVHMAARTHVMKKREANALAKYRAVNVVGTERLLDACRRSNVQRFVYVSSIKAVGEGSSVAYRECDRCQPEDAYGISKREAEQLVESTPAADLDYVILRPPLVYGPGVTGNFSRIVNAVHRGIPLPLGCVSNARSLIYVDNLSHAIAACLSHPAVICKVFHVADAEPLSTQQLIGLLAEAMGKRSQLIPIPVALLRVCGRLTGANREVQRLTESLTVTTEVIRNTLGWEPPVTSAEGIRRTVAELAATNRGLPFCNFRLAD